MKEPAAASDAEMRRDRKWISYKLLENIREGARTSNDPPFIAPLQWSELELGCTNISPSFLTDGTALFLAFSYPETFPSPTTFQLGWNRVLGVVLSDQDCEEVVLVSLCIESIS